METIDIKSLFSPNDQESEAYKTLRCNIQFYGNEIKIIGLTSCTQEKGKSEVALRLAISMAEVGKKVIIVDADMCKSVLSEKVTIARSERGLSNYLIAINSIEEIIYQTDIDYLSMILSGTAPLNYSELPCKEKLSKLLKELAETYDYVLVDTPPLDAILDGAEVANVCDGMILVVRVNAVDFKAGRKAKNKLELVGRPILGAVLLQGCLNEH